MRRLMLFFSSLLIVLGLVATTYVSYRHYLTFRRLPKLKFSPEQLTLPLTFNELAVPGMRWVEIEVTPAASSSQAHSKYRDAAESPRSLILQFSDQAAEPDIAGTTPRRYRGVLYTAINRSRPGASPDPLIRDLKENGISPSARFAVLMIARSPWLIWKAVFKEGGVLVSGALIVISLLILLARSVKALFQPRRVHDVAQSLPEQIRSSWIQKRGPLLAVVVAAIAVAWALYLSARAGPILPIGTILGFGLGAALSLVTMLQRYVVRTKPQPVCAN